MLQNGRIHYTQAQAGYRTGLEPVLLAAAIPARPGERVVEAGCGAGAGLLCLVARVTGLQALGLEIDPPTAALARANLAANAHTNATVLVQDVTCWQPDMPYDHAFANPPWHRPDGTPSPNPDRKRAKQAAPGLLRAWATALGAGLRRRGTLSFILPAASLTEGMTALTAARCPEIALFPFWPRDREPARLIILQGTRDGAGVSRVHPGLILHTETGSFTEKADSLLRYGAALGT